VYAANHYRGIHLTTILSKVVERSIGNPLIAHLQSHGFGDHQWAFRKMSSARDLLTVCVSAWILAFCRGCKVGLYLSDITAAFDRVFKDFLMAKLLSAGVANVFLDFLSSYLEPRVGRVAVGGVLSDLITLDDMVFQGTVLGPVLWNTFFNDVADAASWHGGTPETFADDLAVHKCFDKDVDNSIIELNLKHTHEKVHHWGRRHRVEFDETKEKVVILHPTVGVGDDFKYLGCLMDSQLRMSSAVDHILSWARPKVKALIRTRTMYDKKTMLQQYKTHIWGGTEYANGAILHACDTVLSRIDRLQQHFLDELHLTAEVAFLDFNFAPATLRRDIGILGFIHKRVLGLCHPGIERLLPFLGSTGPWHDKQLESHTGQCLYRHSLFFKSLFGHVCVYNRLQPYLVEMKTVKEFQRELTAIARSRCLSGIDQWSLSFHSESHMWRVRFAM
jgi:hypothetical protein